MEICYICQNMKEMHRSLPGQEDDEEPVIHDGGVLPQIVKPSEKAANLRRQMTEKAR